MTLPKELKAYAEYAFEHTDDTYLLPKKTNQEWFGKCQLDNLSILIKQYDNNYILDTPN